MSPRIPRHLLVACLLLLVASCNTATTPEPTPSNSTVSNSTPTNSAPVTTADLAPNSVKPLTQKNTATLALSGEGLLLITKDTGSARLLPFDAEREQVIAAVSSVRGKPAEQGTNADCGLGYTSWADGLTLHSLDDRFVGWHVNDRRSKTAKTYTTAANIGIGSTRAELEGVYNTLVEQTSLGTEFSAGNLYGILDGTGADAKVINFWGGRTCIFR